MNIDKKIIDRLNELVNLGEQVLATRYSLEYVIGDDNVNTQLAMQWISSIQNLLARVFGENNVHLKNINKLVSSSISYSPAYQIQGILKSAKDDYEHGFIFEVKTLVQAEIFDDILDQAKHLIETGYYQPAAVVIGSILEDFLRKSCLKHSIGIEQKSKLDKMNSDLAKAGAYNLLTQKQITAFVDLRNKAAHGKWTEFEKNDVERFYDWLRSFIERNI